MNNINDIIYHFSFWSRENPRWVGERNVVAPEHVMAWAGIIDGNIIGSYFFDANVSSDTYLEMLTDYLLPELHVRGSDSSRICYMHDGAPARISRVVRQCLSDNLMCWIGRGEGSYLPWPPRSPDLNMLDFFLWGVLQDRVNHIESLSIDEVQEKVAEKIYMITPETLQRVHHNLFKRL